MQNWTALPLYLLFAMLLGGCAMGWQGSPNQPMVDQPTERTKTLYRTAEACQETAVDAPSVQRCIDLYEAVLLENPGHYPTRVQGASLYILKGTAYAQSSADKRAAFQRAMRYAENAMYTNLRFMERVETGMRPWEAADVLGAAEVEAMYLWVTALQYQFKETMSLPSQMVNLHWLQRALLFLERIERVAPEFGGGGVEVAKAICYLATPEFLGGSPARGDQYMQMALARGDDWLLPRWAYGKYYLPVKGERKQAADELSWVAARDIATFRDPYPWRVHFRDDARRILEGR